MVLLDTNVLSELMRPDPHPAVLLWSDQLDPWPGPPTGRSASPKP
jgi:predicted nucleic acid-binding protein